MSLDSMYERLRNMSADCKIRILPVDGNKLFWVRNDQTADYVLPCKNLPSPNQRLVVNVLKQRPAYPWKRNRYLSHSRKVKALKTWRSAKPQLAQMFLPRAFGKIVARLQP
jgi:hypothetical protein